MQDTNLTTVPSAIEPDESGYFYTSYDKFLETYTTDLLGRRTNCTPEIAEQIGNLIIKGLSLNDACAAVGISKDTPHQWIRKARVEIERLREMHRQGEKPDFKLGMENYVYFYEIYSRAVPYRKARLLQRIEDDGEGDWRSSLELLQRMHPEEYGRKTKVEVYDWRMEVIQLIKDGIFSYNDLLEEISDREEVNRLFKSAGVTIVEARAIEEGGNES